MLIPDIVILGVIQGFFEDDGTGKAEGIKLTCLTIT